MFVAATEAHVHVSIPAEHHLLAWIAEYSAYVLNTYEPGRDNLTPFRRLHGKDAPEKTVEFVGESLVVCSKESEVETRPNMDVLRFPR